MTRMKLYHFKVLRLRQYEDMKRIYEHSPPRSGDGKHLRKLT